MNKDSPVGFDIRCPHFAVCSGCVIDQAVNSPPVLQDAKAWFKEAGVEDFVLCVGDVTGWRMRAKLAVRGTPQNPLIGLYKEGSHDVIAIPMCRVHHPAINRGVELVKALIKHHNLSIYDEETKTGDLRYLQFAVERSTGRLHVTFVLNFVPEDQAASISWREVLKELWKDESGPRWHSFSVNFNTRRDNVIFSPLWSLWFGDPLIWETFLGVDVCFQPSSFAQANTDQFECLLRTVNQWVPDGANIAEYYAGGGVIGLTLAAKAGLIRCSEINSHAHDCFEQSRQKLLPDDAKKISWSCGPSYRHADWLDDADVIIVDPPRKGVEGRLIATLKGIAHAAQLIYVSCGWRSFKEDAAELCQSGWRLDKAEGHLFFPGSNHIEIVALFSKV